MFADALHYSLSNIWWPCRQKEYTGVWEEAVAAVNWSNSVLETERRRWL